MDWAYEVEISSEAMYVYFTLTRIYLQNINHSKYLQ